MNFKTLAAVASLSVVALAAVPAGAQDQPGGSSPDPVGELLGATPSASPEQPPTSAAGAPATATEAPAPAAQPKVRLPGPSMNPGAKLRFALVSTDEVHGGPREGMRTNRQVIELQIMPRKAKARVIRYVIRSGEVADDPLAAAMLNASRDLATDYEADAAGKPLRLVDWDGVRAAMLKTLIVDPSAPVEGVHRVQQTLSSMDAVSAIPFAIPETLMLSDMQGWPPLAPGRHDDPPEVADVGGRQARLTSERVANPADAAACTVRLVRTTTLDPASPAASGGKEAETLETNAEVSTLDGWVVRLTQTRTHKSPAGSEVRTWTLTRDDPPACKAG